MRKRKNSESNQQSDIFRNGKRFNDESYRPLQELQAIAYAV